jgi:hypothetical protein
VDNVRQVSATWCILSRLEWTELDQAYLDIFGQHPDVLQDAPSDSDPMP